MLSVKIDSKIYCLSAWKVFVSLKIFIRSVWKYSVERRIRYDSVGIYQHIAGLPIIPF